MTTPTHQTPPPTEVQVRLLLSDFFNDVDNENLIDTDTANAIVSVHLSKFMKYLATQKHTLRHKIGMLRQWLNEKPKDLIVTNEMLEVWLLDTHTEDTLPIVIQSQCSKERKHMASKHTIGPTFLTAEAEMRQLGILNVRFEDGECEVETNDRFYREKNLVRLFKSVREDLKEKSHD